MAPTPAAAVLEHIKRIRNQAWPKQVARRNYQLEDGARLHVGDLNADQLAVGAEPLKRPTSMSARSSCARRHKRSASWIIAATSRAH